MVQKNSNGKMNMPGYEQKVDAEKIAARNARILQEQREVQEEMRRISERAAQLEHAKKSVIEKTLPGPDQDKNFKSHLSAYAKGLRTAVKIQLISFAIGSGLYGVSATINEDDIDNAKDYYTAVAQALVKAPYATTHSYGQAIKNAYLFDGFSAEQGSSGTYQAVCGLIAMLIVIGGAVKSTQKSKDEIDADNWQRANYNRRQRDQHAKLVDYVYRNLETLTDYEYIRADDSIFGREPADKGVYAPGYREMYDVLQKYAMTLVPKMAEIDRHYFDNLVSGGLENANWDVANAIIAGHLKSHPEDYNEIIKIIDESTMDPALVKKYGKGKTVSFGAVQAMAQNNAKNK